MNRFDYIRPSSVEEAVQALASTPDARALAGGTNLVDLMKYDVEKPSRIVDLNHLPLNTIDETEQGGLRIGALVNNADLAWDPRVEARYPLLSSAIMAGASPQLRNAATTGGNLLQRTRCYYFYDAASACNKREPGSGCPAIGGINRIHAVLGASDSCIATHPSDMCVALAALDAQVHVAGPDGSRSIAFSEFHRLPGDRPDLDNTMRHGELITAVELPPSDFGRNFTYLKIRDRLSDAFALVSAAVALRLSEGKIVEARIALGGVSHKPWRDRAAEAILVGQPPNERTFEGFANRVLEPAQARGQNGFKIELARRLIVRAARQAAAGTPQSQTDKRIH
jgi:xanthine dehydrogenase YagS FAD-binding subunit